MLIALAGCGDDAPTMPGDAGRDSSDAGTVPFDSTPSSPQADQLVRDGEALFFRALHGETERRQGAIDALRSAVALAPDHPRGNFLYGMALLSSLTEDGNLDVAFDIQPALQHAADLDPGDRRIPGWLAIVQVRTADALGNQVLLEDAAMQMIAAADAYPEFNNVSLAIAFAKLPTDSPYPAMALERLDAIEPCSMDICRNSERVPHNEEGTLMLFGDVHARLGHRTEAESYYRRAVEHRDAGRWPHRAAAQAILDGLDERIALFGNPSRDDDPLFFSEGTTSCVGCHAE